jgi:hypothetical protein
MIVRPEVPARVIVSEWSPQVSSDSYDEGAVDLPFRKSTGKFLRQESRRCPMPNSSIAREIHSDYQRRIGEASLLPDTCPPARLLKHSPTDGRCEPDGRMRRHSGCR